jgi:hypothetical protein
MHVRPGGVTGIAAERYLVSCPNLLALVHKDLAVVLIIAVELVAIFNDYVFASVACARWVGLDDRAIMSGIDRCADAGAQIDTGVAGFNHDVASYYRVEETLTETAIAGFRNGPLPTVFRGLGA